MQSADLSDQIVQIVQTTLNPFRLTWGSHHSLSAQPSYLI